MDLESWTSLDFLKEINRDGQDETDLKDLSIHLKWSFSSISIEMIGEILF